MPIVYGSSSNLLSIRKKKLIYCLESTVSICIVLQHCFAYKKEFFGTTEALSLPRLLTLFHPPLSNGGFQEVTFFFFGGQLVILGCISLPIVLVSSRAALRRACCCCAPQKPRHKARVPSDCCG